MIDTTFDFRTDSNGKDPDSHSPTLRRYHKLLWSKPLPSGKLFHLDASSPSRYLYHQSELGEFVLTSDSVMATFGSWKRLQHVMSQFSEADRSEFGTITYTIGGMMVFPGNRIDGKNTINAERGFNSKIADRMDLTLECIRRHYQGQSSPLYATLSRYSDFFALFSDFEGYVDHFLLNDLVDHRKGTTKFFMPFDDFQSSPVPAEVGTYTRFRSRSIDFVSARNARISDWVHSLKQPLT